MAGLSFEAATAGYEEDYQAKSCNDAVVEVVRFLHEMQPEGQKYLFELGSGTGGTSSFLFPTLNPWCSRYVFTDLSTAFLMNARSRFQAAFPYIEFALYNADKDPVDQGFSIYDVNEVPATNIIHATIHLATTVNSIHRLLGPHGHLIFNEVQNAGSIFEDVTFGLTEGWWMFTDTERRPCFPLMRLPNWSNLFSQCSYKTVWHTPDQAVWIQQMVICAQVTNKPKTYLDVPTPGDGHVDPTGTYLITGGVGGLGLVTSLVLLERGAKHIILQSRRDRVPTESLDYYAKVRMSVATIQRERGNAGSAADMARLADNPSLPRVFGVVQGAGVLSDGTIVRQNRDKYTQVFQPKAFGAIHLHRLCQNKPYDMHMFMVFSSAAGFFGSPGQSNHSSANTMMERLSHFRSSVGQAGCSISWGAMAEVGYAARHAVTDQMFMVPIEYTWAVLDTLLTHSMVCCSLNPNAWAVTGTPATVMFAGASTRFRSQAMAKMTAGNRSSSFLKRSTSAAEAIKMAQAGESMDDSESVGEAGPTAEDLETFNAMQALHDMWQGQAGMMEAGGVGAQQVL